MPTKSKASLSLKVQKHIAAIEQMADIQMLSLTVQVMRDFLKGDLTMREVHAIDRAMDRRTKVLEEDVKSGRISRQQLLDREWRGLPRSFRKSIVGKAGA
jgi:hypothetical protein